MKTVVTTAQNKDNYCTCRNTVDNSVGPVSMLSGNTICYCTKVAISTYKLAFKQVHP